MPLINLIEKEELFEPSNPALQKVNAFLPELRSISDEEFNANVDKVVDKVCAHFGIE